MSSILDALRKLEEEKAQHPGAPPSAPRPIDPPAREPAPRRSRSRRPTRGARRQQAPNQKLWLVVPVIVFALGIIWAATTQTPPPEAETHSPELMAAAPVDPGEISDVADRDTTLDRIEADLVLAASEPIPEPPEPFPKASLAAPIQAAIPKTQPQPVTVKPEPPAPDPDPIPIVTEVIAPPEPEPEIATEPLAPIRIDVSPVPMEEEPAPEELVVSEPPSEVTQEPIEVAQVEPKRIEEFPEVTEETIAQIRTEPSERYQRAMAVSDAIRNGTPIETETKPKVEEDIRRYAIMTRTVRAKYNIPELDINMLSLPNERKPLASALINYNNVYVGETIPDTMGRVHLIGVEIRGIAVEVEGQRYYYPK